MRPPHSAIGFDEADGSANAASMGPTSTGSIACGLAARAGRRWPQPGEGQVGPTGSASRRPCGLHAGGPRRRPPASSVVLPMPGSPSSTRGRLRPARTSSSQAERRATSTSRPRRRRGRSPPGRSPPPGPYVVGADPRVAGTIDGRGSGVSPGVPGEGSVVRSTPIPSSALERTWPIVASLSARPAVPPVDDLRRLGWCATVDGGRPRGDRLQHAVGVRRERQRAARPRPRHQRRRSPTGRLRHRTGPPSPRARRSASLMLRGSRTTRSTSTTPARSGSIAGLWCWGYRVTQAFPAGLLRHRTGPRAAPATWKAVTAGAGTTARSGPTTRSGAGATAASVRSATARVFALGRPAGPGRHPAVDERSAAGATHTCGDPGRPAASGAGGHNSDGQVGHRRRDAHMAAPVQVGTSTWKSVSADGRSTPRRGSATPARSAPTTRSGAGVATARAGRQRDHHQPHPAPSKVGTATWTVGRGRAAPTPAPSAATPASGAGGRTPTANSATGPPPTASHPVRAGDRYAYVGCSDSPPITSAPRRGPRSRAGVATPAACASITACGAGARTARASSATAASTDRSVPAQVGTDTSWNAVSAGGNHTEALHG